MSKVADSIRRGLEEAVAYARGGVKESRLQGPCPGADRRARHSNEARHDSGGVRRPVRIQRQYIAPLGARQTAAGRADARLSARHRARAEGGAEGAARPLSRVTPQRRRKTTTFVVRPGRHRERKRSDPEMKVRCSGSGSPRRFPLGLTLRRSHKSSSLEAAAGRPLLREAGKVSPKATDGVWKAGRLNRKFAVTFVQAVWRRSSGPHPIRRFAPPSPASWGRDPRGDLRCVTTAGLDPGVAMTGLPERIMH